MSSLGRKGRGYAATFRTPRCRLSWTSAYGAGLMRSPESAHEVGIVEDEVCGESAGLATEASIDLGSFVQTFHL